MLIQPLATEVEQIHKHVPSKFRCQGEGEISSDINIENLFYTVIVKLTSKSWVSESSVKVFSDSKVAALVLILS